MNDLKEKIYSGKSYINGKFIDSNKKIDIYSPINNSHIGDVVALTKIDIDEAFLAAHNAFNKWSFTPSKRRIELIKKMASYLIEEKEFLANLITLEVGKSYKESLSEVERSYQYILDTIDYFEKHIDKPIIINESSHGIKNKIGKFYRVPIGVVLAISPFNYPINLSISKIIPSLIVGNTVVFKPATYGSLVCSQLARYFDKSGFDPGVFNLVTGKGSEIGDYIVTNKYIQGISFTGSTDVGKKIASQAPMKKLILELGGKDAAIVLDDIDVLEVAKEIVKGAYGYSGQRCTAIKRIIVLNEIADRLVIALREEILKLRIGNPFSNPDIVPMIDKKSLDYVLSLIQDALVHGGNIVTGNQIVGHNLLIPTLVDNVSLKSRLAWEEPFGPVVPIIRVKDISEAISVANASNFGLQGSVFTNDKAKALLIANHLNTGTVNINKSSSRGPDIFPFIGVKDSGFGVQGIEGAMVEMTRIKGIVENS